MDALLIGYARVSTDEQDLTAQRDALAVLGVSRDETRACRPSEVDTLRGGRRWTALGSYRHLSGRGQPRIGRC